MRTLVHRRRRGYAVLTCLVVISLLALLGSSLLALASTGMRVATRRRQSTQALNLAMGGADDAIAKLKAGASYSSFSNRMFGPGTLSVSVATPASQPDRRIVTGTGSVTETGQTITRTVRATCLLQRIPEIFYNALAAKTDFGINGNVTIQSTPLSNKGNVHCNGNVGISGSAVDILGKVTASGTVSASGDPNVTGGMTSGVPPMSFPDVDSTFKALSLVNGTMSPSGGMLTIDDPLTVAQGKINGSLVVGDNGCTINGVVWVTGDMQIRGPVYGIGTFVVDGNISIDARYTLDTTAVTNVLYISTSTSSSAVDLGGNRTFKGLIYAPYGGVRVHGTPEIIGGIASNTMDLSGNPTITKWTEFDDTPPPMPTTFQVSGWEEQ